MLGDTPYQKMGSVVLVYIALLSLLASAWSAGFGVVKEFKQWVSTVLLEHTYCVLFMLSHISRVRTDRLLVLHGPFKSNPILVSCRVSARLLRFLGTEVFGPIQLKVAFHAKRLPTI